MSFVEIRLPVDIERGASGGANFNTTIATTVGGFEKRNANWDMPRYQYNISYGIRTKEQMETVIAFFMARQGRLTGFRFKDWSDYQFRSEALNPSGDLKTYQAIKRYVSGVTFARTIKKFVNGSINVYQDGLLVNPANYTVFRNTGLVVFNTARPVGAIIEIEGEFDVPVRFDTDFIDISVLWADAMTIPELTLIELRLP
jgi:uncharacterized protein (TIGR02217 family)